MRTESSRGGPTRSRHERPSLEDVWRWAPLLALAAYLLAGPIPPHDLWWHLRSGQLAFEEGWISSIDRFSFTRSGEVWINQSWLMQLALYGLFRLGGLALVQVGCATAIVAGYAVLTSALLPRYGTPAAMLAGLAAFGVGALNTSMRPQAISFLCFGALVAAIELHRHGQRGPLRWAPLLFAFWVNSHGAFAFAGVVLALYVLGRTWELRGQPDATPRIRELWLIGVSAAAALAITPEGPRAVLFYFSGFFVHGFDTISEFQPLQIRDTDGALFFAVLAASVAALWRSGWRPAPDQIAALVCFGIGALYARRIAPWFGFVLAPVLAAALARLLAPRSLPAGSRARNALYLAFAAALLIGTPVLRARVHGRGWISADTPVAASAELCRIAPDGARVFQDVGFASYQIFSCPRLRVYADPRIEFYPRSHWEDYTAVVLGRYDWEAILERWSIGYVLTPSEDPSFAGLRAALAASGRWSELHRDATATLWSHGARTSE